MAELPRAQLCSGPLQMLRLPPRLQARADKAGAPLPNCVSSITTDVSGGCGLRVDLWLLETRSALRHWERPHQVCLRKLSQQRLYIAQEGAGRHNPILCLTNGLSVVPLSHLNSGSMSRCLLQAPTSTLPLLAQLTVRLGMRCWSGVLGLCSWGL